MKTEGTVLRRATTRILLLLCVVMMAGQRTSWATPPGRRETAIGRGLEKVGDFFSKVARKLEQPGHDDDRHDDEVNYGTRRPDAIRSDTGLVLPSGYRAGDEFRFQAGRRPPPAPRPSAPPLQVAKLEPQFTPPNFQPNPQPSPVYQGQSKAGLRSSVSLPVPLPGPLTDGPAQRQLPAPTGTIEPFEPPSGALARPASSLMRDEKAAAPAVSPTPPLFGTPVPGQRGFVYPPGVEQDARNMLDVRDFAAGQKVRDPRTGQVFLVPPR